MTARAEPEPQIVRSLTSFVGGIGDILINVREGENWASDDPFVRKYRQYFGPLAARRSGHIEQATAAPGEKRGA